MKLNTLNNLFAASAVAAIVLCSPLVSSAHAETGKLIGDGIRLPREVVPGKSGQTRATEIWGWMRDRGATNTGRICIAKAKVCTNTMSMTLDNGGELWLQFRDHYDTTPDYYAYCRKAPTGDTIFCYNMQTGNYYGNMKDSVTGKWETIYDMQAEMNERKEKQQTTPAASDIEL